MDVIPDEVLDLAEKIRSCDRKIEHAYEAGLFSERDKAASERQGYMKLLRNLGWLWVGSKVARKED